MKRIYFTVTNDLNYDQRMHRICGSLANAGFEVILVGRLLSSSIPLTQMPFKQKRLKCIFNKGFAFYAEYNLRLFFYLLSRKMDGICAIDLDTILPCFFVSQLKGVKRVYDAHEYFTELKEVRTRPRVRKVWTMVEKFAVPKFNWCYTVGQGLAGAFQKKYNRHFTVIRNLPVLIHSTPRKNETKFLLFQGAVNEARGFEYLIPAMKMISYPLVICGDGNFMEQLKKLIEANGVQDKVELKGMMVPSELRKIALEASLGIGLAEKEGINQFLALPNKFTEYMHAGLPQITMAYPEYERINSEYRIAVLIDDLSPGKIADAINKTMENEEILEMMKQNALKAREVYCWQEEEKILIGFYKKIFGLG